MNPDAIRPQVLESLVAIAPEIEPDQIKPAKPLRNQVDLDSVDWLNFLISLHQRFGVDIPETEYARLRTIDDIVGFLAPRLPD